MGGAFCLQSINEWVGIYLSSFNGITVKKNVVHLYKCAYAHPNDTGYTSFSCH